ncbi:hypothetical protein [Halobacterium litoreum]|uniref:Uncharacterized protein n=1 Tax=Halobacterium litoreum TaxID=2039234 RepID=A0ABD5NE37_9EURY|nr:hypothetical protein [Halobacterium litoreum]
MSRDSGSEDGELEGQRGTRSSPRIRKFFRLLGFERTPSDE